jgi:hypothetical protein
MHGRMSSIAGSSASQVNTRAPGPTVRRLILLWITVGVVGVAAIYVLGQVLPISLLDFDHYYQASRELWQGRNPYGIIEFFAPPWMALLLAPLLLLSPRIASAIWIVLMVGNLGGAAVLAVTWLEYPHRPRSKLAVVILGTLAPSALYVYITGQVTGLVGPAAILAAWLIGTGRAQRYPWLVASALLVTTLKPHIVAVLVLLCGLELLRRRTWSVLARFAALLAVGAAFSFVVLPAWPEAVWSAWRGGAYLGGPGLVAAGYIGLTELGIPTWVFLPLATYVVVAWWKQGLSPWVAALALAAGLLVVPYSRIYDQSILWLPLLLGMSAVARRNIRADRGWLVSSLAFLALVVPEVGLDIIAPALLTIALLLAVPSIRDGLEPVSPSNESGRLESAAQKLG